MRFVWAVVAFILAAVMIGAGIAQRTVFQGETSATSKISVAGTAPYVLIDGTVLDRRPGTQTLRVQGDGTIFAAYGRTDDLKAWLSDADYTAVSLNAKSGTESKVTSKAVTPEESTKTDGAGGASTGTDAGAKTTTPPDRSPVGSDLWLDEFQQDDLLVTPLKLPADMSVLIASDGTKPAPTAISITWPLNSSTPWAGPLIVVGAILMLIGVFLYVLGIRHVRRSRGPRRKSPPPLADTQPIDTAIEAEEKGVISAGAPTRRRAVTTGRRALIAVPAVAVSALLFAGCSADAWPQLGASPTPSPSESIIVPEGQQAPAVTKAQAERILGRVAKTVADADAKMDGTLAATRLEGAALAVRNTNYTLRGAIADFKAPDPIAAKPLSIVLPQAIDGWPRTVMAVVADGSADSKVAPTIMVLTQHDAWSEYKLSYESSMEASAKLPDLSPTYVGATMVPPDLDFLAISPEKLSTAYADILNNGEQSQYYGAFDGESDQFRVNVANDRKKRLDEFNQTGASTGTMTFLSQPGIEDPVALATLDSGAIVAVNVDETETVKPTNADAVIKVDTNPTVKTLTGVEQSSTGFTTTFTDQLFFYVPGPGSTEKIRLLGYTSSILGAKVVQ